MVHPHHVAHKWFQTILVGGGMTSTVVQLAWGWGKPAIHRFSHAARVGLDAAPLLSLLCGMLMQVKPHTQQ
jgi:hypothetical protein